MVQVFWGTSDFFGANGIRWVLCFTAVVQAEMTSMLDSKILLGILALLPLLEAIDTLILFAQKWDV